VSEAPIIYRKIPHFLAPLSATQWLTEHRWACNGQNRIPTIDRIVLLQEHQLQVGHRATMPEMCSTHAQQL